MLFQLEYVSPHGRLDHGGKLENIYRLIDHTMIDVLKNFFSKWYAVDREDLVSVPCCEHSTHPQSGQHTMFK